MVRNRQPFIYERAQEVVFQSQWRDTYRCEQGRFILFQRLAKLRSGQEVVDKEAASGLLEIAVRGRQLQQRRCIPAHIRRKTAGIEILTRDNLRGIGCGQSEQMSGSINGNAVQCGQIVSLITASDIVGRGTLHAGGNSWQGLYELDGVRLAQRGCRPAQVGRVDGDDRQFRTYPPGLDDGRIDPLVPDGVLGGKGKGKKRQDYG